jgi:hypothetical protein
MLVMESPQFQTQYDNGSGHGISKTPQWELISLQEVQTQDPLYLSTLDVDPEIQRTLTSLRIFFGKCGSAQGSTSARLDTRLDTTDLHDLACFILHKLLATHSFQVPTTSISECIRFASSIYMLVIHGPTYYSHAAILRKLVLKLQYYMQRLTLPAATHRSLQIWLFSIGIVASLGTPEYAWFAKQTAALSTSLNPRSWQSVKPLLKNVLWIDNGYEILFRQAWEQVFAASFSSLGFGVNENEMGAH